MSRGSVVGAIALLVCSAGLGACSFSSGDKVMSRSEVERQSAIELARSVGVPVSQVPTISCPGDLKAKVGTTMTCSLGEAPGKVFDTLITVTRVNDSTNRVYFTVKVARKPRTTS